MAFVKALIINLDGDKTPIPVMFNPPEYRLQKNVNYAEIKIPGGRTSKHQFIQTDAQVLNLTLFLDTTELGVDVKVYANQIVKLSDQTAKGAPPRLLFVWGTLVFQCIMVSIEQHYVYFNPLGHALRAEITVTLKGDDLLLQMPRENASPYGARIVQAGETVAGIAAKEYGDPGKWRLVAAKNNITNPLTMPAGKLLSL